MLEKNARNRKRPATGKEPAAKKKTAPAAVLDPAIRTASDAGAPAKAAPRQAAPAPEAAGATRAGVSPEQRWKMIAEAAYYRAQRRGFGGDSIRDWVEAEAEIDASLLNRR